MRKRADPGVDLMLWREVMRGVSPLTPRPSPSNPKVASAVKLLAQQSSATPSPPADLPPLALDRFSGIDRANAERLKRGRQAIEARLDLHGMTQDEAHRALVGFIHRSRAAGKRCVLIITGRGALGGGVLRAAVPRWLAEPEFRPHLLAIAMAQPRDGGTGALYVMLRRNVTAVVR
jgi:DNA-nicking Smr family endonuclease